MLAPFIVRACVAASAQGAHPSANDRLRLRTVRLAASTRRSTADLRAREAASRCLCRHRARSRGSGGGGKPGSSHLASVVGLGPGAASGTGGAAFAPSSFRGPSAVLAPLQAVARPPALGVAARWRASLEPLHSIGRRRRDARGIPCRIPAPIRMRVAHNERDQHLRPCGRALAHTSAAPVRSPPRRPRSVTPQAPPPHAPNAGSRHNDRAGARPARLLRGG
jgi:hypothetical protein